MEEIKKYWNQLDGLVLVRKRELALGALLCATAGLSAGLLLSPRKTIVVGGKQAEEEKKKHHLLGKH